MGLPYSLFNPDQSQAQPQTQGQPPQSIIDFLLSQSQNQGNSPASPQQNQSAQPQQAQPQQQQPQPAPDQQQQQPPANNAQNAGPVKAGLRSVLGGLLGNFSYGAGQAMVKASGGETDADKAMRLATMAHVNAQTAQTNATTQLMQTSVPFTLPNGATVHLPAKMASDLMKQQLANQGKQDVVNTQKRYITTPVGVLDTQTKGADGLPSMIPNTGAGITITADIAKEYGLSSDWIGKPMKLTDLAAVERGGAAVAPTVSTTQHLEKDAAGNLNKVTTTSTSRKVLGTPTATPGQAAPGQNPPAPGVNRSGVTPVIGADGKPFQTAASADTVYAFDPKTNQTISTTRADAGTKGLQITANKVSPTQVRKDESLSNRVADVQRKVGDYADSFSQPLDESDKWAISYLMDHHVGAGLSVEGLSANVLPGYVQDQLKRAGIGKLSDAGMKRFIGFNQARESLSGYQQVLTNSSRSSDKVLELQLEQLPPPIADSQYANLATGEFQKNLDIAGQHIPIFPGSAETQQSIKAQQLANRAQAQQIQNNQNNPQAYINRHNPGAQNEPPRPSTVPGNYVFNPNGPKGAGWYRP